MDPRLIIVCLAVLQASFVICDPYHLHGTYGKFSSPHFPSFYENNANYNWTVAVGKGFRVVLYFTSFDLEDSFLDGVVCSADYLEIFEGELDSNITSGRFCGNSDLYPDDAPTPYLYKYRASGNSISVRFVSDYSNDLPGLPTPTGFQAIFYAEDIDECKELEKKFRAAEYPETVGKCDHYCNNYIGGYRCTCKRGYKLATDGYTCQGKCSHGYTNARAGVISSPGYPTAYPKKTDCDWTIETEVGQLIQLDFIGDFGIEAYSDTAHCPYDWLKIIDGSNVMTMCGSHPEPNRIVSTSNFIKLEFHSDMVQEMAGFQISHKVQGVYCDEPVPPEHGRVSEAFGAVDGLLPYESVVVFECESGYEMKGVHKITCLKDGTFDDVVPLCQPSEK